MSAQNDKLVEALEPCPWCGSSEHLTVSKCGSLTGDMPDRPYRVVCDHIDHDQVQGPVAYGQTSAIAAWNRRATLSRSDDGAGEAFQQRVQPWLMACFGEMIAGDREERNHRFLEEALELVQSCGCTASEAHQLVDYVYGRPVGEPAQEVGGVMVTLAALCLANGLDMHRDGETELARIWTKVEAIRAKQAAKPKHSPLPAHPPAAVAGEGEYLIRKGGYYYRPNAQGYTTDKAQAGRYSLDDAIRHSYPNGPDGPRDGMSYEPAPAAPQPAPDALGTGDGLTVEDAWQDLVEKDDRTSPEEYPDMALITRAELADYMRAAQPADVAVEEQAPCERCQGNGEIVTDWERYMHGQDGDSGDEGTSDCPDCYGTGYTPQPAADAAHPPADALREAARKAHDTLIELNPNNYTHEDVCAANDAAVEAILLLADALGERHGKTEEWWNKRRAALSEAPSAGEG